VFHRTVTCSLMDWTGIGTEYTVEIEIAQYTSTMIKIIIIPLIACSKQMLVKSFFFFHNVFAWDVCSAYQCGPCIH
jgi:hypothetical protein